MWQVSMATALILRGSHSTTYSTKEAAIAPLSMAGYLNLSTMPKIAAHMTSRAFHTNEYPLGVGERLNQIYLAISMVRLGKTSTVQNIAAHIGSRACYANANPSGAEQKLN